MAPGPEATVDARVRLSGPATWLLHHKLACSATLARLGSERISTLLVMLTIGIALVLPGLLYVAVERLAEVTERWDGTPRINVFLTGEGGAERALSWGAMADVADVVYQSPEASLEELLAATGFGGAGFGAAMEGVLAGFEGNPLPAVAIVTPTPAAAAPARIRALAAQLQAEPGVEGVQVDLEWLQRLKAGLALMERLTWGLGMLLAAAVVLVVGSLTRMAVTQREDEIRVLKLVGGSDGFVLRPFLYLGLIFGFAGGLAAVLLLALALAFIGVPVAELARSYGSDFRLGGMPWAVALVLLGGGGLLGWLAAMLTARRQLAAIEP
ncbi:MAG: cell division protein [Gammaproteobacteria bacterium]|nr:cell division protein [Gammaproteobacteria bacterium]